VPQQGEATYAGKLTVDEFRLDPARPAVYLERLVRAGNPRPGAWFTVRGRRVKVWQASVREADDGLDPAVISADAAIATVDGMLALEIVQPEAKRAMTGRAWRAGLRGDARVDAP
jgi:methionyl-tRNA formyltransferase